MNCKGSRKKMVGLMLLALLLSACSILQSQPTSPIATGIEGKVYFADTDEPIPDVAILLNDPQLFGQQNPDLTTAETKTDSQGRYAFIDIAPGAYVITLQFIAETRVSSIDVTLNTSDYLAYFEGTSDDGTSFAYIAEPEIAVLQGEIVQENFVLHR